MEIQLFTLEAFNSLCPRALPCTKAKIREGRHTAVPEAQDII